MSNLEPCKVCGREIAISAKSCPNCGATNKKSGCIATIFKFIGASFLLLIAFSMLLVSLNDAKTAKKPAKSAYDSAKNINYRDAILSQISPDTLLSFSGEVSQIVGDYNAMVLTKESSFGYTEDLVFLNFDKKPQIISGDIVRIFGRCSGTKEYTTVLRTENVVPNIIVDYYDVIRPKN